MFFIVPIEELKKHLQGKARWHEGNVAFYAAKAVEIDRKIRAIEASGGDTHYHLGKHELACRLEHDSAKDAQLYGWMADHLPDQHAITLSLDEARQLELIPKED